MVILPLFSLSGYFWHQHVSLSRGVQIDRDDGVMLVGINMTKAILEIPTHDTLEWRIVLLGRTLKGWQRRLVPTVIRTLRKEPTPSEQEQFRNFAKSSQLVISEIDLAVLMAGTILSAAKDFGDETAILSSRYGYIFKKKDPEALQIFLKRNPHFIKEIRASLSNDYKHLLTTYFPGIRAKLACLELIALIAPDAVIPKLIGITPQYLKCNVVQAWLSQKIFSVRYLSGIERKNGSALLNEIFSMMKGRPVNFQPRKYQYWTLIETQQALKENIDYLRSHPKNAKFADFLKERWGLSDRMDLYENIFLKSVSSSTVAIQILSFSKKISSPKAFQHLNTYVRNLAKKNSTAINDTIVRRFLDFPKSNPMVLAGVDPFEVLNTLSF